MYSKPAQIRLFKPPSFNGASYHPRFARVLTDKLLVLPNQYAVLGPEDAQALALPDMLNSTGHLIV
jgi:hypothetical protein